MSDKLKFSRGNAKLDALERKMGKPVYTFSLLSGHTCPFAKDCLSKAVKGANGKTTVVDGPHTQFRCFSASQEALYPAVFAAREHNTNLLRGLDNVADMVDLIDSSLPKHKNAIVRIHVGGDFFNQVYFDAWLETARRNPGLLFYAYTKSLPFWAASKDVIPTNFVLTASYGGFKDKLIGEHDLRFAKVVFSEYAARKDKLPIDHDDTHAANPAESKQSFALLLHGVQPKGTKAAKARNKLQRAGKGQYKRKGK